MDRKISRESIPAMRAAGAARGAVPVGSLFCCFTMTGALQLVSLSLFRPDVSDSCLCADVMRKIGHKVAQQ